MPSEDAGDTETEKQAEAVIHLQSGEVFYNQGDYIKAREEFEKALEISPDNAQIHNWLGRVAATELRHKDAEMAFREAVDLAPDKSEYQYNLGLALQNLGRYEEAIGEYKKATEIDPGYVDAYNSWGLALSNLKKYEEAIEKFKKAIEIEPHFMFDPFSGSRLVDALEKLKPDEKKKAVEDIQKILGTKPESASSYNSWGLALSDLKKYEEAIEKFKKAIEIEPHFMFDPFSGSRLVDALEKLKPDEKKKAVEDIQKILGTKPESASAYNNWGNSLSYLGKYEEAIEKYEKTTDIDPGYVDAYINWGLALHNLRKYEEAIEKYKKTIEIDPNNTYAYNSWGLALSDLKKYEEAIEKFKKAIEINPDSGVYSRLVEALEELKPNEKKKAVEDIQKILGTKPESASAYNKWGSSLSYLGKYEEAIEKYKKTIETDPNNSYAYNGWGLALSNLRKYEEAIEKYEKTIEIDPEYVSGYNNWGNSLSNLKKYEDAIAKYEKTIEIDPNNSYAYNGWGLSLHNLRKYEEAIEKYKKTIAIDTNSAEAFFNWGLSLAELKEYEEAIEKYNKAVETDTEGIFSTVASHSIAHLLSAQGKYKESWKEWEKTRIFYENAKQKARESNNAYYFLYYGWVLHEIFNEYIRAEKVFKEGLELDPDHAGIFARLVNLYLEMKDEDIHHEKSTSYWKSLLADRAPAESERIKGTTAYWKAWENYRKAEGLLKEQLKKKEDVDALLQLGELYLAMEECEKAEECMSKALKEDSDSVSAYSTSGILCFRKKDYKKAIQFFREACNRKGRDDLTIRSNLAEAYLKSEQIYKAKTQYKKILSIAPCHVESHIGLGEVYTALGENGDEDMFDKAIYHFTTGINIGEGKKEKKGNKTLKRKELAAALYSRGFARVKLYEKSKTIKDESLLTNALDDFKKCFKNDPYHHKAKRAKEKIEQRYMYFSKQRFAETYGPLGVIFLSTFVFILSQVSFYFNRLISIDVSYYILITFGSLIFIIAGLYLPQILKMKVGGIELEKSPVEQISTQTTLGISK